MDYFKLTTNVSQNYNNLYKQFSRKCLEGKCKVSELKENFLTIQDCFVMNSNIDNFELKTIKLIRRLDRNKQNSISNIINTEIAKKLINLGFYDKAEKFVLNALNYSERNNDKLHVVARLGDLEKISKHFKNKRNLEWVLKKREECILDILNNYKSSTKNFRTITTPPTSIEKLKTQLAFIYTDYAHLYEKNNPKMAIAYLHKAQNIYYSLGKDIETQYYTTRIINLEKQISENKKYKTRGKADSITCLPHSTWVNP